jgi:hypothetical protein
MGGGAQNRASGIYSTVGGGSANQAGFIGSPEEQVAYGTIGGGGSNLLLAEGTTIGGGRNNEVHALGGTIAGGGDFGTDEGNQVFDNWGAIGGGRGNIAGLDDGSATGDPYATVAGGLNNHASGFYSTVGGGGLNLAGQNGATVIGGQGNQATGVFSVVAGGIQNTASGDFSFAAGNAAEANHDRAFVWSGSLNQFESVEPGQFLIDAPGGVNINTNVTSGFDLLVDGSAAKSVGGTLWAVFSDARLKQNINDLDGALDKLTALRGVTFEYANPDHFSYVPGTQMGVIAQEVEQVFPQWVKESGEYKTVNMSGIEALVIESFRELRAEKDEQVGALTDENKALRSEVDELRAQNDALASRLAVIEAMLNTPADVTIGSNDQEARQ